MYIILGVTYEDNKVHKQAFTNYNRALNFMSYLQGNGVGFILDKGFPSAYPKYAEANQLIIKGTTIKNNTLLNKLKKLDKAQGIRATRLLLSM